MNGVRPVCGTEVDVMSALVSDQIAPHDVGAETLGEIIALVCYPGRSSPNAAVSTSLVEIPCTQLAVLGGARGCSECLYQVGI